MCIRDRFDAVNELLKPYVINQTSQFSVIIRELTMHTKIAPKLISANSPEGEASKVLGFWLSQLLDLCWQVHGRRQNVSLSSRIPILYLVYANDLPVEPGITLSLYADKSCSSTFTTRLGSCACLVPFLWPTPSFLLSTIFGITTRLALQTFPVSAYVLAAVEKQILCF